MLVSGYRNEGITISYQTRRVDLETASKIIQRATLSKVREWCAETGQNLIVWEDHLACFCRKTKSGYTVHCIVEDKTND